MKSPAKSRSWPGAANSARKRAAGTTPPASPKPCAARKWPTITATFPIPTSCPSSQRAAWLEQVSRRVVELPLAKKQRLMRDFQLPASDAQTFVWDVPLGDYFEALARQSQNPKAVANWVINNLRAKLAETQTTLADLKFKPEHILELIALVDAKTISSSIAQQVFAEMFAGRRIPRVDCREERFGPGERHRRH